MREAMANNSRVSGSSHSAGSSAQSSTCGAPARKRCSCTSSESAKSVDIRQIGCGDGQRPTKTVAEIPATVRLHARSKVQSMHHNFELELSRPRLDVYFLTFCVNHITWHHHSSTIIRCRESFVKVRCQSAAVRIDTRRAPTPSARQSVTSSPCFADQRACLPKQQTTWHGFCPDAAHWTTYFGRVLCLSPLTAVLQVGHRSHRLFLFKQCRVFWPTVCDSR